MSPIQLALERVVSGIHLTQQEAMDAMGVIMDGDASNAQIGAWMKLPALRRRCVRVR